MELRTKALSKSVCWFAWLLLGNGCSNSADSGQVRAKVEARILSAVTPGIRKDSIIVLVYDPSDLFSCSERLLAMKKTARAGGFGLLLAFTREPSALERRQMLTSHIAPNMVDNTLAAGRGEYLIRNGEIVRRSLAPYIGKQSSLFLAP